MLGIQAVDPALFGSPLWPVGVPSYRVIDLLQPALQLPDLPGVVSVHPQLILCPFDPLVHRYPSQSLLSTLPDTSF